VRFQDLRICHWFRFLVCEVDVRKGLVIEKRACWNHFGEEMNVVRRVEGRVV
jgi:hypothetical protein